MYRIGLVAAVVLCGCAGEVVHHGEPAPVPQRAQRAALTSGFTGPLPVNAGAVLAPQADGTVIFSSWANTAAWSPVTNQWTAKAAPQTSGSASGTVLSNGKVMRAGAGAPGSNVAQLYDPTTNTWLPSTLNAAHNFPGVAPLRNGSALVAGSASEQYDVATNTWTTIGAATLGGSSELRLLRDGRVLDSSSNRLFDAKWNLTTFLSPGTVSSTAGLELEDGKVLLVGPAAWYLVDVDASTWLATGQLTTSRTNFALVRLTDGRVLRAGGTVSGVSSATTELFDPLTRTWTGGPSMLQARSSFAALAVGPGMVLIAGGAITNGLTSMPVPSSQGAEVLDVGCVPTSCAQRQWTCGVVNDGCGLPLDCGSCGSDVCSPNHQCVACVPTTCAALGATCGTVNDGCGGTLSCGTCGLASTCSVSTNRCETTPGPDLLATWNSLVSIPVCTSAGRSCDTNTLVVSRSALGEPTFPNTLNQTCADGTAGQFHVAPSLDRVVVRSPTAWLGDGPIQLEATVWVSSLSERLDVFVRPTDTSTWTLVSTVAPTAFGQQVLTTSFTLPRPISTYVRTQYRASASAVSCAAGSTDDRDDLYFHVQLPDVTAPSVSFSSPVMGSTVRGVVSVSGSSIDTAPTTQVFDGTTLLFSNQSSFWSGTWNTLNAAQGTHQLSARATDASGNVRTTLNLFVQVDNAPVVTVSAPSQGAVVGGAAVSLSASATAVTGRTVSNVEFFVDGASVGVSNAEPYQVNWDARPVPNGAHVVTARATDSGGLSMTSSAVNVSVENDVTAPAVTVNLPAANAVVRGTVVVDASVTDVSAISSVQVFDGVSLLASGTTAAWTFAWDTSGSAQGGHALRVVATDEFGNVGETSIPVLVDNNPLVAVASPAPTQVVSQSVSFEASVALGGTHALSSVTWSVDGTEVATLTAPPWSLTWDSREVSNGVHAVVARVVDSFGLMGESAPVSFETSNDFDAPVVALSAPANAALVRGVVQIEGTLSDVSPLTVTRVAIDGATLASGVGASFLVPWDTTSVADGAHVIRLEGTDAFSQFSFLERTVTVDNTLPALALTAPAAGLVGGDVVLSANASDLNGVVQVDFFANGALVSSDASSPYSVLWSATVSGPFVLTAVAIDGAGNVRSSDAVNVTVVTAQAATFSNTFRAPLCATASTSCSTGSLVSGRGTMGPETNRPNTLSATCNDGNSGTFHGTGESIDRLEVVSVNGGPLMPGATVVVRATVWATRSTDRVDFYSTADASSPSWTFRATRTPQSLNQVTLVEATFVLPAGASQAVRAALRRGGSAATCPSGSYNDRDDLVFVTN